MPEVDVLQRGLTHALKGRRELTVVVSGGCICEATSFVGRTQKSLHQWEGLVGDPAWGRARAVVLLQQKWYERVQLCLLQQYFSLLKLYVVLDHTELYT